MTDTKKTEIPADVQVIIEYTKLKKKYPALDASFRKDLGYLKDSLTFTQMLRLLNDLQEHDQLQQ